MRVNPTSCTDTSLIQAVQSSRGEARSKAVFALANHYREAGNLEALQTFFASEDADGKKYILNGLWGEPGTNPAMGPGIVALAIEGASHPAPAVRTEASYVFQNQCAWGVDVGGALEPLQALLADPISRVRDQAAYAAGNLAKRKQYDLSPHLVLLRFNINHADRFVRNSSAWALWQLSRNKRDLGAAVPDLVRALTDEDEWNGPRQNATGALLHHARKSPDNCRHVQQCVAATTLDATYKEIARFLNQLEECSLRHEPLKEQRIAKG